MFLTILFLSLSFIAICLTINLVAGMFQDYYKSKQIHENRESAREIEDQSVFEKQDTYSELRHEERFPHFRRAREQIRPCSKQSVHKKRPAPVYVLVQFAHGDSRQEIQLTRSPNDGIWCFRCHNIFFLKLFRAVLAIIQSDNQSSFDFCRLSVCPEKRQTDRLRAQSASINSNAASRLSASSGSAFRFALFTAFGWLFCRNWKNAPRLPAPDSVSP